MKKAESKSLADARATFGAAEVFLRFLPLQRSSYAIFLWPARPVYQTGRALSIPRFANVI
jgi:hypothetical protein